jgi:hypothetical protein
VADLVLLHRAPGSLAAEIRRSMRRLGVRRASRLWRLAERDALEIAAGLRIPRALLVAAASRLASLVRSGDV